MPSESRRVKDMASTRIDALIQQFQQANNQLDETYQSLSNTATFSLSTSCAILSRVGGTVVMDKRLCVIAVWLVVLGYWVPLYPNLLNLLYAIHFLIVANGLVTCGILQFGASKTQLLEYKHEFSFTYAVIIAPIVEEWLFRLTLPQQAQAFLSLSLHQAGIFTTLLFGASHLSNLTGGAKMSLVNILLVLTQAITTSFLGWILFLCESLPLSVVVHSYYNALMLYIIDSWRKWQIEPEQNHDISANDINESGSNKYAWVHLSVRRNSDPSCQYFLHEKDRPKFHTIRVSKRLFSEHWRDRWLIPTTLHKAR
jgi:membrane protease YdiL (CAAX protease family)